MGLNTTNIILLFSAKFYGLMRNDQIFFCFWFWAFWYIVSLLGGGPECGIMPAKVYLGKGEKTQIIFWTDQVNTPFNPKLERSGEHSL